MQTAKVIFDAFHGASGLACNVQKSQMVPIWCSDDDIAVAHAIFPCQLSSFPLTYLGLPLSVSALLRGAFQPLIVKMVDRLPTWKGRLLRHSGRLTLIKTTLFAGWIYMMISIKILAWVRKAMDKVMKAFLWTGSIVVQAGKCLVAWPKVPRPLCLGGLGVLDLQSMGMALRVRWLWLHWVAPDRPWSAMSMEEDMVTKAFFKASVGNWQR
jgi:hypothetical protein